MSVERVTANLTHGVLATHLKVRVVPPARRSEQIRIPRWEVQTHESLEATRGEEEGLSRLGSELAHLYFKSFGMDAPVPPRSVWERMQNSNPYGLDLREEGQVLDLVQPLGEIKIVPYDGGDGWSLNPDECWAVLKNKDEAKGMGEVYLRRERVHWKDVDYFYNPRLGVRLGKADFWLGKMYGLEQRLRNPANNCLLTVHDPQKGEILGALEGVVRTVGIEPQGLVWKTMLQEDHKARVEESLGTLGLLDLPDGTKLGSLNEIYVLPERRGEGVASSLVSSFYKDNRMAVMMSWSRSSRYMRLLDSVLGGEAEIFISNVPMADYPLNAYVLWWLATSAIYEPLVHLRKGLEMVTEAGVVSPVPLVQLPKGFLARPPEQFNLLEDPAISFHLWPLFLIQELGKERTYINFEFTYPILVLDPSQLPNYHSLGLGKMRGLHVLDTMLNLGGRFEWLDRLLRVWIETQDVAAGYDWTTSKLDESHHSLENGYGGIIPQGTVGALLSMVNPRVVLGEPNIGDHQLATAIREWIEVTHPDLAKYLFPIHEKEEMHISGLAEPFAINSIQNLWSE